MINFVMVWIGEKYGPEYPAILADMIARNASRLEAARIWCVTDRPDELPEGVEPIAPYPSLPGWWQKVWLFSSLMPWAHGERVVYLDLDVVITGSLEELVETKGIVKDWLWPCYNSSVMVWDHGEHPAIWSAFTPDIMTRTPGPLVPAGVLPRGEINGGDQEWISELAQAGDRWDLLRPDWCVNYRLSAQDWPPTGCKVVSFNGKPKPHEITEGWVTQAWKIGGLTSLPAMDGVNVENADIEANIAANLPRDVKWFTGFGDQDGRTVALVCGAPSMRDSLPEIRAQKRRGARLVSVNNALRYLVERGITPDVHIMLDARPENAAFVEQAPESVRYLLASQCHPDVFEALTGRDVVMWHNAYGDSAFLRESLAPWWDEGPDQRPCILVPGGGTVGLRALWLSAYSGYKVIHVYGMDSSFAGDEHHAYPQALNDADRTVQVTLQDKTYRCAVWMARQAQEFQETWRQLRRRGVNVIVHGRGLIPDLCRHLREEAIAA
jgi:uncharacterized Rossmann fold enzyme